MKVTGQAARLLVDYLKAYAAEGGFKAEGESGKILKMAFDDEAFRTWVNAYIELIPRFGKNLREILMNLSLPREDKYESMFQRDLHSATSVDKLATFESRLTRALALPFEEYLNSALTYLPEGTEINVNIYITLDPFNTGMMRPGKVFLSVFMMEITPEICKNLAHEFHHAGAIYWLEKNP